MVLRAIYVLLLLCILPFSAQGSYKYDAAYSFVSSENIEFDRENFDYDDVLNLRYCCSKPLSLHLREKAQGGSFFSLSKILVATKGLDDIGAGGILAINKSVGGLADGAPVLGKDVSTVLANAAYRDGGLNKGASAIRDIADGHLFKDGNKRTAFKLIESLNLKGVSSAQIRGAIDGAANGSLKSVDDIAKALGGG